MKSARTETHKLEVINVAFSYQFVEKEYVCPIENIPSQAN